MKYRFTDKEIESLKLFCETCDKITDSRFIRNLNNQPSHIFIGTLSDGRKVDEYPRYDETDFRAFLTHYRKIRAQKEPTFLNRILNLLKQKGFPSDITQLDHAKNEIKAEGASWWGARIPGGVAEDIFLAQVDLENLILNGEVFHSDPEKRKYLQQTIGNWGLMKAVAVFNYMRFARTVIFYSQQTAELIRKRGYRDSEASPPKPSPI